MTHVYAGPGDYTVSILGEMTGFGLRRWPDGASYSGQFEQGEMHGQGTYIAPSGDCG